MEERALTSCVRCDEPIPRGAETCPHCETAQGRPGTPATDHPPAEASRRPEADAGCAMGGFAVLGAGMLILGVAGRTQATGLLIAGAWLFGMATLYVVVRSAVLSALRAHRRERGP